MADLDAELVELPTNLVLPVKLDAFIFNQSVCNNTERTKSKIAPITQPNYTFLRMKEYLVQHDVLDPVNLRNSAPSSRNSRFTDIGQGIPRKNRIGVYLHWMIPRPFRGGVAGTASANGKTSDAMRDLGLHHEATDDPQNPKPPNPVDNSVPSFLAIPNRWLVIRTLDPDAATTRPQKTSIPSVQTWVIESDRTESIDNLSDKVDLQVDVSPFITTFVRGDTNAGDISVDEQAEVFIGKCFDGSSWNEDDNKGSRPRVSLTAASSSNQLFMDFQHHCGNVFSMVDTLSYRKENGQIGYLEAANANYYVVGWHSDVTKDLMFLSPQSKKTRQERFSAASMTLTNSTLPNGDAIGKWLKSTDPSRSLCHGAMYGVQWLNKWDAKDPDFQPPEVPADTFSAILADVKKVSVGTTPVDSILAHVKEHKKTTGLEFFINQLSKFLRSEDESVGGQDIAADEIQNAHFARFDGGKKFALSDTDLKDPSKRPTQPQKDQLYKINALQHLYDGTLRRIKQLRWDTFAVWWQYISDIDNQGGTKDDGYKRRVGDLRTSIYNLREFAEKLDEVIRPSIDANNVDHVTPKEAVRASFHQQNEPTLLFSGLQSGWMKDFKDALSVRLDNQFTYSEQPADPDIVAKFKLQRLRDDVKPTIIRLVKEFLHFDPGTNRPPDADIAVPPLYHDGRDAWSSRQPWFPLYIEWRAEYYHIPFDKWALVEKTMETTLTTKSITYGLTGDVTSKYDNDVRVVSGRSLVLPQPSFSLRIMLERLFSIVPKEVLDPLVPETDRQTLLADLDTLGFLSTPLGGLFEHLATRFTGTHVKPLVRVPPYAPVPLKDAQTAAAKIEINRDSLIDIDIESDPTPYGAMVPLLDTKLSAFKPVTHGQMRFTEINVVDKFGQVAAANDPLSDKNISIIPVISDYYHPQPTKAGDKPNVVKPDIPDIDHPEFIQLPPTINQPARMNAEFVRRDLGTGLWNTVDVWDDSPIWGWVMVNFADNGLQFFLEDGTFYREVRLTQGVQAQDAKWLPFKPPAIAPGKKAQLDFLIEKMTGDDEASKAYLAQFWDMLTASTRSVNAAPDAYSQFLNSLVGKPLALVNVGWSLELSTKSRTNQSTVSGQDVPPKMGLLPDDGEDQYRFPVKFGDKDRGHDGLIGYFEPRKETEKVGTNDDLLLDRCFTYYGRVASDVGDKSLLIHPSAKYPKFSATWLDPEKYTRKGRKYPVLEAALDYEAGYRKTLNVFGAIVDPFLPVNAYTSILPIKSLKLPTWTWESALKKMTTFLHAGPLVVTADVAPFARGKELAEGYDLRTSGFAGAVSFPALQVADWTWLQPYDVAASASALSSDGRGDDHDDDDDDDVEEGFDVISELDDGGNGGDGGRVTAFMPFDVAKIDVAPTFGKGPYTAVEGYMQLRAPVEQAPPSEQKQ